MGTFERDLEDLINRYSMENGSDTPDFILASYMMGCLEAWNRATKWREKWYGREKRAADGFPGGVTEPTKPDENIAQTK